MCINQLKLYLPSIQEALILLEASRRGHFPIQKKRLSMIEKDLIEPGSIFIYNEKESGIKRWSDGKIWSPSKLKKGFFLYQQANEDNKLIKKAITITAPDDSTYHIISYITKEYINNKTFSIPSECNFPDMESIKAELVHYKFKTSFRNRKTSLTSPPSYSERQLSSEDQRQLDLINCYVKL